MNKNVFSEHRWWKPTMIRTAALLSTVCFIFTIRQDIITEIGVEVSTFNVGVIGAWISERRCVVVTVRHCTMRWRTCTWLQLKPVHRTSTLTSRLALQSSSAVWFIYTSHSFELKLCGTGNCWSWSLTIWWTVHTLQGAQHSYISYIFECSYNFPIFWWNSYIFLYYFHT